MYRSGLIHQLFWQFAKLFSDPTSEVCVVRSQALSHTAATTTVLHVQVEVPETVGKLFRELLWRH